MRLISVADAKERFSELLDGVQQEPVLIRTQRGVVVAVLLSVQEYARLRNSNIADLHGFCDTMGKHAAARGLSEAKLKEILSK